MFRLGVISREDMPKICEQMKDNVMAMIEKLQAERARAEENINNKARNALKEAELQLSVNCSEHGHGNFILMVYKADINRVSSS